MALLPNMKAGMRSAGMCVYVCHGNWFDRCLRGTWLEEMTNRDVVDKLEVAGLALGPLSST